MLCSRQIETIYNKLPCIFVLNVHIFLKLCQHVMNFNVPGIHYIFTFSALLILGINNFQCSLDIQDLVFNIALFYYLGIFSTWLCTIITGDINNDVIYCSYSHNLPIRNEFCNILFFCYLNSWQPCHIRCLTKKKK